MHRFMQRINTHNNIDYQSNRQSDSMMIVLVLFATLLSQYNIILQFDGLSVKKGLPFFNTSSTVFYNYY